MDEKGAYVLEGGHRLGAAHLLGMKEIPAMIGHEPDDYAKGGIVSLKEMEEYIRQKRGEHGAKRVQRAADEIPGLENMFTPEALKFTFERPNAALMSMNPANFEKYAERLHDRFTDEQSTRHTRTGSQLSFNDYMNHLANIKGGFDEVPFLELGHRNAEYLPSIEGHEGRHRSRVLTSKGVKKSLVQLMPSDRLGLTMPKKNNEKLVEKMKKTLGADRYVSPQGGTLLPSDPNAKMYKWLEENNFLDTNRPQLPEIYNKGGSVEPKKTVKAYKLFRVHEKHPGKLFPLFVDANTPVEMGKWVHAKIGEQSGEKVKSKIGPLAMRPGWHAGDLPVATHIGEKSHPKLTAPDTRPHNHAWAEVEMPNDVDWQSEANKRGMNKKGELISKHAHITDQVPNGGHYRYKTNPNMTGNWLIGGAMKVNKILSDADVKKINERHGVADLPRAEPFKKKTFGFAHGGIVAPESWVAEEHIHYGVPEKIKPKFNSLREELAHKVAQEKEYQKAIKNMPFNKIPTLEAWKKSQPTHAHHLDIEERPL
jgi:hypothetical protein